MPNKWRSRAWWSEAELAFVQGDDGVYPTISALATRLKVSVATLEKRSAAEAWPAKRKAWQAVAGPLKRQQQMEVHLKEKQASNRTYEVIARALRNEVAKTMDASAASGEPLSVGAVLAWTRALGEAQRIERVAAGETPAILTGREQVEIETAEIEARMAKASGTEELSEEEQLEALASLEGLPVARLLRIWGLAAPLVPKKGPTAGEQRA
jgi:hypothetical protein